jgi:hypothetical protein
MTREEFIRKWLGNREKQYTELFRDEMRHDLDLVISSTNDSVDLLNKRFEDCQRLTDKFNGDNLLSLLLAATFIGQTYEINKK